MTDIHRIRLLGPWKRRLTGDSSDTDSTSWTNFRVDSPGDWRQALALGQDQSATRLLLRREFHWTFPQPPPTDVELVFCDILCAAEVHINDQSVGQLERGCEQQRYSIARLLDHRNNLMIALELATCCNTEDPIPFSEVCLEITSE